MNRYIQAYTTIGLAALQLKASPSVGLVPHEDSFTARYNLTLEIFATYNEQNFGHRFSIRGISEMMYRKRLIYTKLTYTLAAADPEKPREFSENTFPELKTFE